LFDQQFCLNQIQRKKHIDKIWYLKKRIDFISKIFLIKMKDKKRNKLLQEVLRRRKKYYKTNYLSNKTFLDLIHNYRIIEKKTI